MPTPLAAGLAALSPEEQPGPAQESVLSSSHLSGHGMMPEAPAPSGTEREPTCSTEKRREGSSA
eukprot:3855444-Pyramimonas_sp.AAC.1